MSAYERTRDLIARQLGVSLGERTGDAYRDARGALLPGEWLGGFAQPGVILNKATAVSARLDDQGGAMIDEYGEANLVVLSRRDDRIELAKRYAASQFIYVGRLGDGTLAGYWYAADRPEFAGVFWFARVDRLDEATAAALRARVRSRSVRRLLVKIVLPAVMLSPVFAFPYPAVFAGGLAANVGIIVLLRRRMAALRAEVELWRKEL